MTLYLSRLTLRRDPPNDALKALLDPDDAGRRADAHHRLLWTLFSDGRDRDRDFLWRAEPRGRFYVLSHRRPEPHGLFEAPEVKAFEPVLTKGDRLTFLLRANATRSIPGEPLADGSGRRQRGRTVDVAMHLLKDVPRRERSAEPASAPARSQRAATRHDLARQAAEEWISAQGARHGFSVRDFTLEHYSTVTLAGYRGPRKGEPRFGVFDMTGTVEVTEPDAFLIRLAEGFGRAKAYGCGLMLIRRG